LCDYIFQLLTSQQLQQGTVDPSRVPTLVKTVSSVGGATTFGTTNMTIPVSTTGVNINVSLPQQQKLQGGLMGSHELF